MWSWALELETCLFSAHHVQVGPWGSCIQEASLTTPSLSVIRRSGFTWSPQLTPPHPSLLLLSLQTHLSPVVRLCMPDSKLIRIKSPICIPKSPTQPIFYKSILLPTFFALHSAECNRIFWFRGELSLLTLALEELVLWKLDHPPPPKRCFNSLRPWEISKCSGALLLIQTMPDHPGCSQSSTSRAARSL